MVVVLVNNADASSKQISGVSKLVIGTGFTTTAIVLKPMQKTIIYG